MKTLTINGHTVLLSEKNDESGYATSYEVRIDCGDYYHQIADVTAYEHDYLIIEELSERRSLQAS